MRCNECTIWIHKHGKANRKWEKNLPGDYFPISSSVPNLLPPDIEWHCAEDYPRGDRTHLTKCFDIPFAIKPWNNSIGKSKPKNIFHPIRQLAYFRCDGVIRVDHCPSDLKPERLQYVNMIAGMAPCATENNPYPTNDKIHGFVSAIPTAYLGLETSQCWHTSWAKVEW